MAEGERRGLAWRFYFRSAVISTSLRAPLSPWISSSSVSPGATMASNSTSLALDGAILQQSQHFYLIERRESGA